MTELHRILYGNEGLVGQERAVRSEEAPLCIAHLFLFTGGTPVPQAAYTGTPMPVG